MEINKGWKGMKLKPSAGEWRVVVRPEIGDGLIATLAHNIKIVSADGVCKEELASNASLIAAAPKLLAALKACVKNAAPVVVACGAEPGKEFPAKYAPHIEEAKALLAAIGVKA